MLADDIVSAAEGYVERHGDILQRARVAALVRHTPPPPEALARWRAGWQPDGGWATTSTGDPPPGETRGRSNLIATVRALRHSLELDIGIVAEVRGALFWLMRQQRSDGSFVDEYPVVSDALDAKRLGVPDERMHVWATATALHYFDECVSGVSPFSDARERAYEWLKHNVAVWDSQHTRAIWMAAASALRREGPDSPMALKLAAQLTLRITERPERLTARDLADLARTLAAAGWPSNASPVSCAMTALARMRRDDGAFADAQAREDTVEATIAAIRAYLIAGTMAFQR